MTAYNLSSREMAELFAYLDEHEHYVFLDTAKPDRLNTESLLFTRPLTQLRCQPEEDRHSYLELLSSYLEMGYYLAGWFSYEFFQAEEAPGDPEAACLLADFGVYHEPRRYDHRFGASSLPGLSPAPEPAEAYQLSELAPGMGRKEYCRAIERILDYIAAGDTYQVNYTFKFTFRFSGQVYSLYRDLRRSQPVPYGCCIRSGDHYILSFSPELFFRAQPGSILARPMKGTMKRGRTGGEDVLLAARLRDDEKNRSENVMIVDLLRNDLSRLAATSGGGTVAVDSLFEVERYQSVFQMTSTIVARLDRQARLEPSGLMQALFPCGSVTGAPKIRTMQIIEELEKEPRGVYTGAIGYFSPDGRSVFNVPIRTVVLNGSRGEMGIGSGIVADSSPEDEWQECLLKARFLTKPLPVFELIETMFYSRQTGILLLEAHLERLAASADYFAITCAPSLISGEISRFAAALGEGPGYRLRLTLSQEGAVQLQAAPCSPPAALTLPEIAAPCPGDTVRLDFARQRVDSSSPWLFHKTTRRAHYNEAHRQARAVGLFDVLFANERGEITEGCISNVFILADGCYYTPPLHCGLLDGVMRRHLLAAAAPVPVRERLLYAEDLLQAERLFVCNSVRGVLEAKLG